MSRHYKGEAHLGIKLKKIVVVLDDIACMKFAQKTLSMFNICCNITTYANVNNVTYPAVDVKFL